MTVLNPIKLLPTRERVASVLRKAILSREMKAGDEIAIEETACKLGVSSTPVREAFQMLASDGLIELRPNRGAVIVGIDEKVIHDHYETRAILEKAAIEIVCGNDADITQIQNVYERSVLAAEEHDYETYSNCNQSFHMEIWIATGNVKLKNILSELWNGLSMGHKVTEDEYAKISMTEHKLILDALEKRDAELAGTLMHKHIIRSMENILTRYNDYEQ